MPCSLPSGKSYQRFCDVSLFCLHIVAHLLCLRCKLFPVFLYSRGYLGTPWMHCHIHSFTSLMSECFLSRSKVFRSFFLFSTPIVLFCFSFSATLVVFFIFLTMWLKFQYQLDAVFFSYIYLYIYMGYLRWGFRRYLEYVTILLVTFNVGRV